MINRFGNMPYEIVKHYRKMGFRVLEVKHFFQDEYEVILEPIKVY